MNREASQSVAVFIRRVRRPGGLPIPANARAAIVGTSLRADWSNVTQSLQLKIFWYSFDAILTMIFPTYQTLLDLSRGGTCSNETKRFQIDRVAWNGVAADHGQSARR